ncbi:MAG: hypothetical protein A3H44_02515 [Gammaproteobacteria bacterium RIFCSPLOWO2_02_FULL_57_10]|nr:MAG: hypothetical protein A3H44_02515 [Gammaproteobacteria bacterium RIFCSPLOWO2_02_FULL_57_10]
MLVTHGGASFTNLCTHSADFRDEIASTRHDGSGEPARFRAVHVGTDTVRHPCNVWFAQTGDRTMITGVCTGIASIYA